MAWIAPRTWVTSEVVTAALLNAHIRDNEIFLRAHHGCSVFKSGTQTVLSGSTDVISWNSEDFDTDALHDTVTNNSRIVVPAALAGYWEFFCQIQGDSDATQHSGGLRLSMRKNAGGAVGGGTALRTHTAMGHQAATSPLTICHANLVAGDYVECFLFSGGEDRVIQAGLDSSNFIATYLGN